MDAFDLMDYDDEEDHNLSSAPKS